MVGAFGENAFGTVGMGARGSARPMGPSPGREVGCAVLMLFIRAQVSRRVCRSLCMLLNL